MNVHKWTSFLLYFFWKHLFSYETKKMNKYFFFFTLEVSNLAPQRVSFNTDNIHGDLLIVLWGYWGSNENE